jgi:hypothetical protein
MSWLKIYTKFNLVGSIVFFLFSCISWQRGLQSQLYFSSPNVAVYKLDTSPKEISLNTSGDMVLVDEKILKSILFTIRKDRSFLRVNDKETLWSLETIEELLPILKDILSPANKNKTFFIVVKEEDKLSPYSRIFRTTFYLNRNENILQIIFEEIDTNINFGTQFTFSDWANPSFFKVVCKKEKPLSFYGKLETAFQFKKDSSCEDKIILPSKSVDTKIENQINYHWILVYLEKAIEVNKGMPIEIGKERSKGREKRLKELQDLYKKGLINKDDYEIKKAEVLGEI